MDDRLQKFARLVEAGSYTRAARDMRISQPALTQAIAKLERELGASLLIRTHRKLELTPAGNMAYAAALAHRATDDNLRTSLIELSQQRPKVSLGMVDSVAAVLCGAAPLLDELEAGADVSIVVNNSRFLREAVRNRTVDLAFVVDDGSTPQTTVTAQPIGIEPFIIVCRPDRLEAARAGLKRRKLLNLICYDQPSLTYRLLDQALRERKITSRPTFYSTSPDVILRMVLLGKGVAALPYLQVRDLLVSGRLRALESGGRTIVVERSIAMLKLSARRLPACLETFPAQARLALESAWRQIDS